MLKAIIQWLNMSLRVKMKGLLNANTTFVVENSKRRASRISSQRLLFYLKTARCHSVLSIKIKLWYRRIFFLQMSKSRRVIIVIKIHCYHLHSIKHTSIDLYFRGKKPLANQQERRNFNLHYTMSYGSKTIWYIYMSGSKKKKIRGVRDNFDFR